MSNERPSIDDDLMSEINSIPTGSELIEESDAKFTSLGQDQEPTAEMIFTVGKEYRFRPPIEASGLKRQGEWVHDLKFSSGKYVGFRDSHIFEGRADNYQDGTVFFFRVELTGGSRIEEL